MPAAIYGPYDLLDFNGKLFLENTNISCSSSFQPRPGSKRLWELGNIIFILLSFCFLCHRLGTKRMGDPLQATLARLEPDDHQGSPTHSV